MAHPLRCQDVLRQEVVMKRLWIALLCLFLVLPGCRTVGRVAKGAAQVAAVVVIVGGAALLSSAGDSDCEGCR